MRLDTQAIFDSRESVFVIAQKIRPLEAVDKSKKWKLLHCLLQTFLIDRNHHFGERNNANIPDFIFR
jgi:hypothetical protein